MIHFNFKVSEEEAETLFGLVTKAIDNAIHNAQMSAGAEKIWWEQHANYLECLRDKMKNSEIR